MDSARRRRRTQTVREYRNYVHPHKQKESRVAFDQDSVMLCWAPVRAIINDLEERVVVSRGKADAG